MTVPGDAPNPRRQSLTRVYHGRALIDEYAWMLDVSSDEMQRHLGRERDYALAELNGVRALQHEIRDELDVRHVDAPIAPTAYGDWWYFTRRPKGADHRQYLRRRVGPGDSLPVGDELDRDGEVILDGNEIQAQLGGFSLGAFRPSPDHTMLAFGVDATGNERFTLMFRDLTSGKVLEDRLTSCHYTCVWFADGSRLLYTTGDALNRPHRVWQHVLGTPQDEDELLHEDTDPGVWLTVGTTRSGSYLFIRSVAGSSTEHQLIGADDAAARPIVVLPRTHGIYYEVDHQRTPTGQDLLYILNNRNGPNFEVARASVEAPSTWHTVVPHRDDRRLHWVMAFQQHVVVHARERNRTGFIIIDTEGIKRTIGFDEGGAILSPASNPEFDSTTLRVSHTSPITPPSIRSIDLRTGESVTVEEMPVGPALDGRRYDPGDYVATSLSAPAADGELIPISLVGRADLPEGRPQPCVLYAYGAYERVADMTFSVNRLALLDRGFRYAVAHVRGGGELGKRWHEHGRRAEKQNSIDDYLAAVKFLIDEGWTSRGLVVGRSSSAGGLVIGAALNATPESFGAVVLTAPFVDPLTSLLDSSRPLTVPEWDELGNPVEDAELFDIIQSYSPYENIAPNSYPPALVISGAEDVRVSIAEPARWIARLRDRATGGPFVLLPEIHTGHRGARGRQQVLDRDALVSAWIVETIRRRHREAF